ncbi:Uncharacterized SPBc2 prophage-derived protein YoqJ [Oscillibacter sp. PC13]|uniref:SLOG family protein n=1 Tax=Oscillibacter sp. PC13 TaxID=1855299 RepID=UPI0008ECC817|nr:SLOG family protein [Oscillibacter sp. PC13]SFP81078.1 Uncharacterized SPBc2 prophage-derived protein YoqJ [Oscillibacter sp. PC13]
MEDLTCAFTGHRPSSYKFGYDEEHPDCCKLKALMTLQIVSLIENGVTTFLSGMALGADIWGAEIVLACKKKYPQKNIRLIAALPCESQADRWSVEQRERYFNILEECDETVYLSRHYTRDCMFRRNRWLIDHANFVLAVYNGSAKGGTAYTVNYAHEKKRAVIIIDPDTLRVLPYTIRVNNDL